MKNRLFCLAMLCLMSMAAVAQKTVVSGKIVDADLKEPLPGCLVRLLNPTDSAVVESAAADINGAFTLPAVKVGKYILKITYVGFETYYQNLTLVKEQKKKDLGTITMKDNARMMKDAVVTATLAQVEMKGDTFVYNADAYHLPEGSTISALIKELPGAEMDENGQIKINGKTVSRILVNKKEFMGGDNEATLKSLPANIVSKVKAYDKKSAYTMMSGIDDGNDETVLDLSVKKGMGDGWVFNADLAAGNARQDQIPGVKSPIEFPKPLYSGMLNVSRFTNEGFSFAASVNHENVNTGMGGMRGGMTNMRWGGGMGGGISTSTMANVSVTWANDREEWTPGYFETGGSVRFNKRDSKSLSISNSEMFRTHSFTNNTSRSENENTNLNLDYRLRWMPDSFSSILLQPRYSFSKSNNNSANMSATFNDNPYEKTDDPLEEAFKPNSIFLDDEIRVNTNLTQNHSGGKNNNASLDLQLNRRLAKPGRNVNLRLNGNYTKSDNNNFSYSNIQYFNGMEPRVQDRFTPSPTKNTSLSAQFSYTEPVTDNLSLQASYQYGYSYNRNTRDQYQLERLFDKQVALQVGLDSAASAAQQFVRDVLLDQALSLVEVGDLLWSNASEVLYNVLNDGRSWEEYTRDAYNSSFTRNKNHDHNANVQLAYTNIFSNDQELRLTAGFTVQPQTRHVTTKRSGMEIDTTRTTFNWAPSLTARWRLDMNNQVQLNYRPRMTLPSIEQLLETIDDTNPLNISTGNAGLRSGWNNQFNASYFGNNANTQTTWNANANYSNQHNSISRATIYDEKTGAQYSRQENISGTWSAGANLGFNTALGPKRYWNLGNNFNYNYSYRVGYLNQRMDISQLVKDKTDANGHVQMADLFQAFHDQDLLTEAATKTTSLGDNFNINYRYTTYDSRWSISLTGTAGFRYNHTRSDDQASRNIDSWDINYGGQLNVTVPWNVTLVTGITQQSRRKYDNDAMNTDETIWNMQLQKSFLQGNAATISVEWNDILHQRSNVSRTIDALRRSDSFSNTINSYFMCHFIYRFNLIGTRDMRSMMRGMRGMGGFGGGMGGFGGGGGMGGFGGGGGMGGFGGGGRF